MGSGAQAKYASASEEDRKTAIAELSEEEKKEILKALKYVSAESEENKKNITANKAALHQLESVVMGNKKKLYLERAQIEENRCLILKNYSAAFMGNRQMANANTDDIFRNRKAIVKALPCTTQVQLNFVESHTNRARIDYLEHRASMNTRVAEVNEKMAKINALLIEVNKDIMEGNAEIVAFNKKHIEVNTKILNGELSLTEEGGCDPEANKKRIENNQERISKITATAEGNAKKCADVLAQAQTNYESIEKNRAEIYERRKDIELNSEMIAENAGKIAGFIASGKM